MARMLGDRFLPESVQGTRRRVRNRLQDLRQPIRRRREDLVPGPDLVGQAESRFRDFRDRFVSRDGLLARMRSQQQDGETQQGNGQQNETSTPAT